jgi:hypothetical protein
VPGCVKEKGCVSVKCVYLCVYKYAVQFVYLYVCPIIGFTSTIPCLKKYIENFSSFNFF